MTHAGRTRFRYLTFDCYGTLIDWKKGISESLASAVGGVRLGGRDILGEYLAQEKAQEASYQKYREVLRKSALGLAGPMGVEVSAAAARRFAGSVPMWPAFPDTVEFLREMGRKGYRRYILSNVDTDLLEGTIKNWKLEVDGFVTAEQVGSYKPGTGHWERFLEKTGAAKGEVLHVAQSVFHDIVPARRLGISSAWVNRYGEPMPRGVGPMYVSDSLEHLGSLL